MSSGPSVSSGSGFGAGNASGSGGPGGHARANVPKPETLEVVRQGRVFYDARAHQYVVCDYSVETTPGYPVEALWRWVKREYERQGSREWKRRYAFRWFR